jgi:adenylate cyclase
VGGDTVNVASRLETSAEPNRIHVSEDIANAVREKFRLEPRGAMELKGKGQTTTFYLMGLEGSLTARIQRR